MWHGGTLSGTLIYICELGGAADCWCPAEGVQVSGDVYRVTKIRVEPGKTLEFKPGDLVRCATRGFPDGSEALLALERAGGSATPGKPDQRR